MPRVGARDRQTYWLRAGGQQKPVVSYFSAVAGYDLARFGVDAGDLGIETQFDVCFAVKTVRTQRHPIFGSAAGKIVLRQVRPVDRRRGLAAHHDDAAAKIPPPQHFRRGETRRPAADDDDLVRRIGRRFAAWRLLLAFLMNENSAVLLLDPPAGEGDRRRRTHGFAAAQVETGVMPGAADTVPDHEPFDERAVVMAAMGGNGENLAGAADQQDLLVADVTGKFAIDKIRRARRRK